MLGAEPHVPLPGPRFIKNKASGKYLSSSGEKVVAETTAFPWVIRPSGPNFLINTVAKEDGKGLVYTPGDKTKKKAAELKVAKGKSEWEIKEAGKETYLISILSRDKKERLYLAVGKDGIELISKPNAVGGKGPGKTDPMRLWWISDITYD